MLKVAKKKGNQTISVAHESGMLNHNAVAVVKMLLLRKKNFGNFTKIFEICLAEASRYVCDLRFCPLPVGY
ncbi:hypothetical protein OJE16_11505 [Pantoea tagorei]